MFRLNLRVRCQFQQSKRFSHFFFYVSKIKLFLLRSPLIFFFFVLSSPFGNNNKRRRRRQFITGENQLRRHCASCEGTFELGHWVVFFYGRQQHGQATTTTTTTSLAKVCFGASMERFKFKMELIFPFLFYSGNWG